MFGSAFSLYWRWERLRLLLMELAPPSSHTPHIQTYYHETTSTHRPLQCDTLAIRATPNVFLRYHQLSRFLRSFCKRVWRLARTNSFRSSTILPHVQQPTQIHSLAAHA